ncbi:MAG: hypothetical protein RML35_06920 [Chloroherpetonaceae bacterium]|nr:hypothetical protein [Chloroherpetonaceae bacterium]
MKPTVVMHLRAIDLNDALTFNRLKGDIKKAISTANLILVHSNSTNHANTTSSIGALRTLNKTFAAKLSEELVPALALAAHHLGLIVPQAEASNLLHTNWRVRGERLQELLSQGSVPVFAPIVKEKSQTEVVVQSEWLAAYLAAAIQADLLIFLIETKGIIEAGKTVEQLTMHEATGSSRLEVQCAG